MTRAPIFPDSCAIALKERTSVCQALTMGAQTILLRKGGIDEPAGFQPEYPAFWLYPAHFHESATTTPERITLTSLVAVCESYWVDRVDPLREMDFGTAWSREEIEQRFHYRRPGLWLLVVRVAVCDRPREIPNRPEYAGCRSWIRLDSPIACVGLQPVLTDSLFHEHLRSIADRMRYWGIEAAGA